MAKYPNRTHYSRHFTRAELDCKCWRHGRGPKKHGPFVRRRLRRLAIYLERMRAAYGGPIGVNSGYRCKAHNKEVHGAIASQHLAARAADINVPGTINGGVRTKNQKALLRAAESVPAFKRGGIGVYPSGALHVDYRPWYARWSSYVGQ